MCLEFVFILLNLGNGMSVKHLLIDKKPCCSYHMKSHYSLTDKYQTHPRQSTIVKQ